MKILRWDTDGFLLYHKRLERGSFEMSRRNVNTGYYALFYSLSCSCRLCGIDFFEYLTDVINRVAAMGAKATADTCRDLLPDKWEMKQ